MKFILSICFCLIFSFCFSQTQTDMNQEAYNDFKKADKELNTLYQKILKEYRQDTAFIRNLKIAQALWIKLRDAEMKAKYPDRESGYYGSIYPLCWSTYKEELTTERTKKLKIWLTGIEEGDVCTGSVKIKY